MSDTMLHGILQMPPRLWSNDAIDIAQRHGRYLEASERIMELERERDEARRELDELRKKLDDSDTVMKVTLSDETLKDPFATVDLHKLMDEKHIWPNAWRTTLPTCELDRVNE